MPRLKTAMRWELNARTIFHQQLARIGIPCWIFFCSVVLVTTFVKAMPVVIMTEHLLYKAGQCQHRHVAVACCRGLFPAPPSAR